MKGYIAFICTRRKVFPDTEISLADGWDLGDRYWIFVPNIWTKLSHLAGKLSVYTLQNLRYNGKLCPVSGITFLHINRTILFDLSKCFLSLLEVINFFPYEQALSIENKRISVISFLYVCMVNAIYLLSFVETPRKFIIAELSIRKLGSSSVLIILLLLLLLLIILLALMKIRAYGSKALQ